MKPPKSKVTAAPDALLYRTTADLPYAGQKSGSGADGLDAFGMPYMGRRVGDIVDATGRDMYDPKVPGTPRRYNPSGKLTDDEINGSYFDQCGWGFER